MHGWAVHGVAQFGTLGDLNTMTQISHKLAYLLAGFLMNAGLVALAVWLGTGQIAFVLLAIVFMYYGRRFGWSLSKNILYLSPTGIVVIACLFWGTAVAFGIHALIQWQQPKIFLKIIFGFALGAYVAIPNYGLLAESTIPEHAKERHLLISNIPLLTYIIASPAFAYLI